MKELKLTPNDRLFHGTGEEFDYNSPKVGSDGMFWTADSSTIAQAYIPVSGSTAGVQSTTFNTPNQPQYAKKVGTDFYDIEKNVNQVTSYRSKYNDPELAKIEEMSNTFSQLTYDLFNKSSELKKLCGELKTKVLEDSNNNELIEEYRNAKDELDKTTKEIDDAYDKKNKLNPDKLINLRINEILKEKYGYEPDFVDKHNGNAQFEIKTTYKNGSLEILPNDYRGKGKLIVLTPKREMKILDIADGRESDLTDLDYHKYELFKETEKRGYDGIKITDFAQTEAYGNFGHTSIGFFKDVIKDFDIEVIDDVTHPRGDDMSSHDSPEYKKWASLNESIDSNEFKEWFGASNVVDGSGNPLVVYHGTEHDFDAFDTNKSFDTGLWFTSNKDKIVNGNSGAGTSGKIIPVYLKITKMAGWDEYDRMDFGELISAGFDGIQLDDDYVVFEPNQIKSINNNGAYSSSNDSIFE